MNNNSESIKLQSGNIIELFDYKPDKFNKTVLIIGVFHGDEPDGEYLIRRYLEFIDIKDIENRILIVPCLNPDGKALKKRTNANGIDLNRNFPCLNWELSPKDEYYGGDSPASEKETQFIINTIEKYKPDLILTIHEPYRIVNFDGPAKEIAQKIGSLTGYDVQADIGYPTPGSFGTYCGIERNIPVITLELPDNQPKETLWEENKNVFYYLGKTCMS